ncbi:MAG: hypothetical protein JRN62_02385 [Nitrososphaerota archaeon]|jgi:hypothetical protein|nr:hypothetical protein [Nitrososphaerota archaeon]MDG6948860.1 hypothetical protein [Nitrososphaerota archaeon]
MAPTADAAHTCTIAYTIDGRKQGLIAPVVADLIEKQARKQKMKVERTSGKLVVQSTPESTLW